jgi:phosphoesterase RecJ-like protein
MKAPMTTNVSLEDALSLVRTGSRFLVTCHRRPDADALGSAIGFARFLRSIGKEAIVYVPEALALSLHYLPEPNEIVHRLEPKSRFDSVWVMDTAAASLLPEGLPGPERRGTLVIVDHHAAHDDVGDLVIRDTKSCATGEVIFKLIEAAGLTELTEPIATPLYSAIVADTGGFRYPGTTGDVMRLGARMLDAGADAWTVAYNLFEGWELPRLRLLGAVLETLDICLDGRLATLRVTRRMLEENDANDDMVEGMVNYGRMLRGVQIAALVWEWPVSRADGSSDIEIKVSLRSRGEIDVSKIAVALGGGGHRAAAGAQVSGDADSVLGLIMDESRRLLA